MFKVMIVDDEVLIRIGIKSSIEWESNGFQVIGEAQNGAEALELYEKYFPEIVITDIRMPVMNGLELIRALKQKNSHVKIIVLSYYNDFEYVREALKLGAVDYILKMTMEPKDLLSLLLKIKEQVIEEHQQKCEMEEMKGKYQLSIELLEEKLVNDIIKGTFTSESEIIKNLNMINAELPLKSLVVLYLQIDDYAVQTRQYSERERGFLSKSILNLIKEVLRESHPGITGLINEKEFVCLLGFKNSDVFVKLSSYIYTLSNKIKYSLQKFTNFTVAVGVSGICTDVCSIQEYCNQARKAVLYKLFKGKNSVIFYDEIRKELVSLPRWMPSNVENSLRSYFAKGDIEAIRMLYDSIFKGLIKPSMDVDFANSVCDELILILKKITTDSGKDFNKIIEQSRIPYSSIRDIETLDERYKLLIQLTEDTIKNEDVCRVYRYSPLIQKAVGYLYNNYNRDIKLKDVADYVNISPAYLSQLFKVETGENLVNYLNNIRVKKAKELMLNTDMKIYEIAVRVGLENARYFSQVFKKYEKITPAEFRISSPGITGELV